LEQITPNSSLPEASNFPELQTVLDEVRSGHSGGYEFIGQLALRRTRKTQSGKEFLEIQLRDQSGILGWKVWGDSPAFIFFSRARVGDAVVVQGDLSWNEPYGLEARGLSTRAASAEEKKALFEIDQVELKKRQDELAQMINSLADPRLQALARQLVTDFGDRFHRAAAAHQNHHARRGGLAEHTLQMLRAGEALTTVYPELNRDLLLTGILFHDIGKLFETCPPAEGFAIERRLNGELLGHIAIGLEMVNSLWRKLPREDWRDRSPPSDEVRYHLLHLIASHHGELEYGAPVKPKTPEAAALHFIDNLDARLEMFRTAIQQGSQESPGIYEYCRPLGVSPVSPLPQIPPSQGG